MSESNGHVPMIGGSKPRIAPQGFMALVRDLDKDGTFEPESVQLNPAGGLMAVAGRANIVTAEDLVEMIRVVIREELADMLVGTLSAEFTKGQYEAAVERLKKDAENQ